MCLCKSIYYKCMKLRSRLLMSERNDIKIVMCDMGRKDGDLLRYFNL